MKNILGISFVRYSPHESNAELTVKVVECYRKVFADAPWHEWRQCPTCKKHWGNKDRALLQSWNFQHCNTELVDFWPKEQVTADLFHEITPDTSCWLAISDSDVVGFCWGYPIAASDLEKKLGMQFLEKNNIKTDVLIAYQDEVGVIPAYRNRKIAKVMVGYRLDDFIKQKLTYGVVRTRETPEPSKTFLWYQKIGYEILARYPDGRVILGRDLKSLKV